MFHTRMREYFGDTNLSACTRFRSENSCRPTKAFSICRCISSLPENNHTNQHIQDVYMLKQLPHWWRLCVCVSTVPFSQEVADGRLVQSLFFVEKLGHRLRPPLQEVVLHQVVDSLKQDGRGEISMKSSDSDWCVTVQLKLLVSASHQRLCVLVVQSFNHFKSTWRRRTERAHRFYVSLQMGLSPASKRTNQQRLD